MRPTEFHKLKEEEGSHLWVGIAPLVAVLPAPDQAARKDPCPEFHEIWSLALVDSAQGKNTSPYSWSPAKRCIVIFSS